MDVCLYIESDVCLYIESDVCLYIESDVCLYKNREILPMIKLYLMSYWGLYTKLAIK